MGETSDRLTALAEAIALDHDSRRQGELCAAFGAGAQQLMLRFPEWREDVAAGAIYGLSYAEGWYAAAFRFRLVLGLPEARGREREALELAQDPDLEPAEIAVRLRAATPPTERVAGTDNVVAFRRPAG